MAVRPKARISAQQPTMPVIGFLSNSGPNPRLAAAFREGLAEAGQRDRLPLSDHPTLSGDRKVRECALAAWPVDGRATPIIEQRPVVA